VRKIERTTQFKRDYKRETKKPHRGSLESESIAVLQLLASDLPLAPRFRDHALTGEWREYRDCHIKPHLVLTYRKPDAETLDLVRLGTHSELGL